MEKLTRSSLKGLLNRARFACKNGHFTSSFLLLGIGYIYKTFESRFVFEKYLSETPLKPDRVSFCTPKMGFDGPHLMGSPLDNGFVCIVRPFPPPPPPKKAPPLVCPMGHDGWPHPFVGGATHQLNP